MSDKVIARAGDITGTVKAMQRHHAAQIRSGLPADVALALRTAGRTSRVDAMSPERGHTSPDCARRAGRPEICRIRARDLAAAL